MATHLDLINQADTSYNSGVKGTDIEFGTIVHAIIVPKDFEIDLTEDLSTQLAAAAVVADKNDRIFLLPTFAECEDKSSEPKTISFGYGSESTVGDGHYRIKLYPGNPGKAVQKVLRKYNKTQSKHKVILVDEFNRFYVTRSGTDAPKGFTLQNIWADMWPMNTGEGTKVGINFTFANARELNEGLHVIEADFNVVDTIPTVNDVELSVATALTSGTVVVFAKTNDGHDNLFDDYSDALDATAAWTPIVQATGAAITVSAVSATVVNGQKAMSITMTTGLPSNGQKLILKLADVSTLSGLGVVGYESNHLELTV